MKHLVLEFVEQQVRMMSMSDKVKLPSLKQATMEIEKSHRAVMASEMNKYSSNLPDSPKGSRVPDKSVKIMM